MTLGEFLEIRWPDAFVVHYLNGTRETLLRGAATDYLLAADDPEGLGGFSAEIPPKSRTGQSPGHRLVRSNELLAVTDLAGKILWKQIP